MSLTQHCKVRQIPAPADGTDSYYYELDRIAQAQGGQSEYFLGDALGSVRQLIDDNVPSYSRA